MAHGDAVTNSYGVEFKWGAAGLADSFFDDLGDLVELNVAGHYFAKAVGNAYERFFYVIVCQPAGMEQASVRCPLKTLFYCITSHIYILSKNGRTVHPKNKKLF
jgi:hypothetical protein